MEPTSPKRAVGVYFFCWNQAALLQRTLHGAAHIYSRTYTYTDDLAYVCNAPL